MARSDFTDEQLFELGQIEAPIRAAGIKDAFDHRLQLLRDCGFTASATEGGASVTLGALTIVAALCESDPWTADIVCNYASERTAAGTFSMESIFVEDKSQTGRIALEQLERALATLRKCRNEIDAPDIPMGWAFASD